MHTISIFVDQNRIPKLASYFECQTHLAKNLRNSANFIVRNLRTGLKKDPVDRTSNENEVIETVRIGIEMANEKLQKDVDRLTKQLQSLPNHIFKMEELRVRCEPVQILIPSRGVGFQNGREVLDLDCASAPEEVADGPFKVIHWDRVPAIMPTGSSSFLTV